MSKEKAVNVSQPLCLLVGVDYFCAILGLIPI